MFFDGSVNESNRGWQKNQEKISVFTSWWGDDNNARIKEQDSDFEDYWTTDGKNDHLEVAIYDLPSEYAEKIIEMFPPLKPREGDDGLSMTMMRKPTYTIIAGAISQMQLIGSHQKKLTELEFSKWQQVRVKREPQ